MSAAERVPWGSRSSHRRASVGGAHRIGRRPLASARGVVIGIAVGALLWAALIPALRLIVLFVT